MDDHQDRRVWGVARRIVEVERAFAAENSKISPVVEVCPAEAYPPHRLAVLSGQ
jgi:hypothetical protein